MRMGLTVVAEEGVEAVLERTALGVEHAQAPLADGGGGVPLLLEQLGQRDLARPERILSLGRRRLVVADVAVAGVLAGHQATARRGTDGRAGVALGEAHPLLGEAVQRRGANL